MLIQKIKVKLYFIKNKISTFSDFIIYLFSTVIFATFIQHEKIRGTGLVPVKSTDTRPARIPPEPVPEFRSGPNRNIF